MIETFEGSPPRANKLFEEHHYQGRLIEIILKTAKDRAIASNHASCGSIARLSELNMEICELAREAGDQIMRYYNREAAVVWKKDSSPLTCADQASHEFLVRSLKLVTPEIALISEESWESNICPSGLFWLVDPLDGTKEFIKGTKEFTVNIALIEGGRPILGVVHAPALDSTYYASQDLGSWKQVKDQQPISLSTRRASSSSFAVVASKDHAGPRVTAMLGRVPSPQFRSLGSSLKFCLVAEGQADIYLRDLPTMEWDTAAAQCIVEVAGGGVYSLDGKRLEYGKPGLRNPAIMTVGDRDFDWQSLLE